MAKAGSSFTTTLKKSHLEWGSHRHTNSREIVYGEGYLQIPAYVAYALSITNNKDKKASPLYKSSTSDGFLNDEFILASGNQNTERFAKNFQGKGSLKLLGNWYAHVGAKIGDQVKVGFIGPNEILLTHIPI